MNVLVIASHADDEVLGMGGTIAKLVRTGHNIYCWFYFSGFNCNGVHQEQPREVSKILGTVYPPFVMPMTVDNESDIASVMGIARNIEKAIAETKPEVVYMPSVHDLNIDHRRVAEAALVATRPVPGSIIHRVLSYEVPSVTEWAFGQFGTFRPNVYEELSDDNYDHKIMAAFAYEGCLLDPPHPRSEGGLDTLVVHRGQQIGVDYAEAFELVWERR